MDAPLKRLSKKLLEWSHLDRMALRENGVRYNKLSSQAQFAGSVLFPSSAFFNLELLAVIDRVVYRRHGSCKRAVFDQCSVKISA